MKQFHRCGALALSAVMLMSALSGCSSSSEEATTESTTGTTITTADGSTVTVEGETLAVVSFDIENMTDPFLQLSGFSGDTVVATVGDQDITVIDYLYWAAYSCDSILDEFYYYGLTEVPWDQTIDDQTYTEVLMESAIATAGLYLTIPQEAQALGLEVAQEEIDELDTYLQELQTQMGGEQIMTYALWEAPTTYESYRNSLLGDSYYGELYFYYTDVGGEFYATDEDCLAYAESMGYYGAKHILLKTVSDTVNAEGTGYEPLSDDEIASQLVLAQDILAQLDASDDPVALFDDLMNQYSEDSRDATTGELYYPDGYTAYSGQMVTEFETAALALDVYDYSDIVESTYGYHIILRTPLEASDDYRNALNTQTMTTLQAEWIENNPVVTNEVFDMIDLQLFYENLTLFRTQMDELLTEMTAE